MTSSCGNACYYINQNIQGMVAGATYVANGIAAGGAVVANGMLGASKGVAGTLEAAKKILFDVDALSNVTRLVTIALKTIGKEASVPFYGVCETVNELVGGFKFVSRTTELTSGGAAWGHTIFNHPNFIKVISRICLLVNDVLHTIRVAVKWELITKQIGTFLTFGKSTESLRELTKNLGILAWTLDLVQACFILYEDGPSLDSFITITSDIAKDIALSVPSDATGALYILGVVAGTTASLLFLTKFMLKEYFKI